jgi:hypothetical protein
MRVPRGVACDVRPRARQAFRVGRGPDRSGETALTRATDRTDSIPTRNAHSIHSFADLFIVAPAGGPTIASAAQGASVLSNDGG